MSSKGSAQEGLKLVTRVRALLRVAARPITSDVTCNAVSGTAIALMFRDAPRLGDADGLSLNLSKRDDEGLAGGGDVLSTSANCTEGGGSIKRPVIGVLNLPERAMLNAVVPSRALDDDDRGRIREAGAEGMWVVSMDIARKQFDQMDAAKKRCSGDFHDDA
jgi:hypothetical protein